MPVVIYSPGHYFYRVAEEAAVRSFQVSVAGKRNFQGRDKEAETARRHFGPVTAHVERGRRHCGEGVHRIAAPIGWAALALALVAGLVLWRFFKSHEEQLFAEAEAAVSKARS